MYIKESTDIDEGLPISIFGVSELSAADGPGKRVVVFFQGCNARCAWCHSPHSQPPSSPIFFRLRDCMMCMRCESVCGQGVHVFSDGQHILKREVCTQCGRCIEACPLSSKSRESGVLYLPTRQVGHKSLLRQLRPYLKLCDGITLSGGEPLLQTKAALAFLSLCKDEGYHTAVETSGLLDNERYMKAAPYVDVWLFGVRIVTSQSGAFNTERILSSLDCILKRPEVEVWPRIPMVPGVTDRPDVLKEIHSILKAKGLNNLWLNPWNRSYDLNYEASGMELLFDAPSDEIIGICEDNIIAFLSNHAYNIHIYTWKG